MTTAGQTPIGAPPGVLVTTCVAHLHRRARRQRDERA
jgi:hypothetical protein